MIGSQAESVTIEHITKILTQRLQSELKWEGKKPKGLDKALSKAALNEASPNRPARDHTQQIFWKAGLQAWFAYFLANHGHGRHYEGQTAELKTLEAFDLLSAEQREKVATDIACIEAHDSVRTMIDGIRVPINKRRRELS